MDFSCSLQMRLISSSATIKQGWVIVDKAAAAAASAAQIRRVCSAKHG